MSARSALATHRPRRHPACSTRTSRLPQPSRSFRCSRTLGRARLRGGHGACADPRISLSRLIREEPLGGPPLRRPLPPRLKSSPDAGWSRVHPSTHQHHTSALVLLKRQRAPRSRRFVCSVPRAQLHPFFPRPRVQTRASGRENTAIRHHLTFYSPQSSATTWRARNQLVLHRFESETSARRDEPAHAPPARRTGCKR